MATHELELIRRVPLPAAKIGSSEVIFRSLAGTLLYAIAALAAGMASSASSFAACSTTLAPSIVSGKALVGNRIAFTATPTGCGKTPIFRFSVTNVDGSTYTMRRDYAQKGYFEWSPMVEGAYGIKVEVKDAYSTPDGQASQARITGYIVLPITRHAVACGVHRQAEDSEYRRHHRLAPPIISDTPHPLVKLFTVPSCSDRQRITTQILDPITGRWKDAETRSCFSPGGASKTQNFLIGGVRPDSNNNICVRYRNGERHSDAVGATLGSVPDRVRVPLTFQLLTGNERHSNTAYNVAFLGYNSRILQQDTPEESIGGPCCDASAMCKGTSCCSDPSRGPSWQTTAQKQRNCWAIPTAVDVTDRKLLWYWSQTTLGSQNPGDPNARWAFIYQLSTRILPSNHFSVRDEIDNWSPSLFLLGQDDEGRTHDSENPSPNVFRQIDLAGNPVWETNAYALNARLPAGFNFVGIHHDQLEAENNNIILLGYTTRCLSHLGPGTGVSGMTNPCPADPQGNPQQKWLSDAIVVVDRNGNLQWSWNVFDHDTPGEIPRSRRPRVPDSNGNFLSYPYCLGTSAADAPFCRTATGTDPADPTDPLLCLGVSGECPIKFATDYTHSNGLFLDCDGNLIVSNRRQAWVLKLSLHYPRYDGDGSILWKLGQCKDDPADPDDPLCFKTGPRGQETQGMSDNWFSFQHDPSILNDGSLLLWDNRNVKCSTDFYDPSTMACRNGWTDCDVNYTSYDDHACPFSSRGQSWSLDTDAMIANPQLNASFPQLDTGADLGTPPRAVFSHAVGAAQKLPHGGWLFDAGRLTYTGGNMFQAQLFELACIDSPADERAPCRLAAVRVLKTNHLVYRGYRMPNLYRGIPGVGRGENQED